MAGKHKDMTERRSTESAYQRYLRQMNASNKPYSTRRGRTHNTASGSSMRRRTNASNRIPNRGDTGTA